MTLQSNLRVVTASLLATVTTLGFPVTAVAEDPLLESAWRGFDVGHFPNYAPEFMAIGDMNGDAIDDIVVAREAFSGPGISVLLSNGDGTFQQPLIFEVGIGRDIKEVQLADIDSDKDLDVVFTNYGNSGTGFEVFIQRNDGTGQLADREEYLANEGPYGLVVADVTGDDFPDIITANVGFVNQGSTISVLVHNGMFGEDAGYADPVNYPAGDAPVRIAAADLDGDGDLDLATASTEQTDNLSVLFNDGSGAFSSPTTFTAIANAYRQAAVINLTDIDNDGDIDLIGGGVKQGTFGHAEISIRLNDGSGNFGMPDYVVMPDGSWTPHTINTTDLNSDGFADLTMTYGGGRANDGFWIRLSDGSGGFAEASYYSAAKGTREVEAFDVDADGDFDLITAANDSSIITVHLNDGDGTGTFPQQSGYPLSGFTEEMVKSDIDGDGDLDVIAMDSNIRILRNNGDGSFAPYETYSPPNFGLRDLIVEDFTNDGLPDLIIAIDDAITIVPNQGNGTFTTHSTHPAGCYAKQMQARDLDNDGDLDLLFSTLCDGDDGVFIMRNDDDGTKLTAQPFAISSRRFDHFEVEDLNADGLLDIVANVHEGMMVFLGTAPMTFSDDPIFSSSGAYRFDLGDANNDGNLDAYLLIGQPSFGTVDIGLAEGIGDGTFAPVEMYPAVTGRESAFRISSEVDAADMNGDGHDDLVLTSNAPKMISIFTSNGEGGLNPGEHYSAGYSADISLIADFTGDAINDVVTKVSLPPSGFAQGIVVLRGQLQGNANESVPFNSIDIPFGSLIAGDLNALRTSDDIVLRVRSQFGFLSSEPNVVDIHLSGSTTDASPNQMALAVEAKLNNPNGTVRMRLRDWNSNALHTVHTYTLGTTEIRETAIVSEAADYVRASDGRIELSVKSVVVATFSLSGFIAEIDQITVGVQ